MSFEGYNSDDEFMNALDLPSREFCDLALLNRIFSDPEVTQAELAEELNISIGSVNGRLKQLIENGYIEVKQARRRKLRYIITAEGRAWQQALTEDYLQQSFRLYRQVRQRVRDVLAELDGSEVHAVRLVGDGDVADVCRLTCLEHQVRLTDDLHAPALVVDGLEVSLKRT